MKKTEEKLKAHPAAAAFPVMDKSRLEELKADIEKNGQYVEIVLCDGMILDGRNRYEACTQLQIEPDTTDFVGDPWAFAWSLNGARRDLDATVRALIFRRCEDGSAKWAERLAKITEEGNRKKSESKAGNQREQLPARPAPPRLRCRRPQWLGPTRSPSDPTLKRRSSMEI